MRHITEAANLPEKMRALNDRRRAWRAARIAEYGFREDVTCPNCGDVGSEPEPPHKPCFCAAGEPIRRAAEREQRWGLAVPRRFRGWTLDSHPRPDLIDPVRDWLRDGWREGRNLMLLGGIGTGKTGMAVGALRELFVQGASVRFGTVPSLLDTIRPSRETPDEPQRELRALRSVDVLLLDDLGVHKATDWTRERLFLIVNDRHEDGLPTIVTSNCTIDQMNDAIGPRTISRLMDDAVTVRVGGRDLRTQRSSA